MAIDEQLTTSIIEGLKTDERRSVGPHRAWFVDADSPVKFQAKRLNIQEFITPARLVPVYPQVGIKEGCKNAIDFLFRLQYEWQLVGKEAGARPQVFLADAEIVIASCIQQGQKSRRRAFELGPINARWGDADRDENLMLVKSRLSLTVGWQIQWLPIVGKSSQNCRHDRRPGSEEAL